MKLNNYHLRLLAEGINHRGRLHASVAGRIYSTKGKAREVLVSLESWGWIKRDPEICGVFRVTKAPYEAHDMAIQLMEAKEKSDNKIKEMKAEITDKIDD